MSKPLQAIRGMNDILPAQSAQWRWVEGHISALMSEYGFGQIRTPVVEVTELFKRSIGDATDIVEKEMYSFADRNGDSITLRPEGTASCLRAVLENALVDNNQLAKLWYIGPMFRYERPQKGRYRQFHQFGAEVFNGNGPDVDAELIALTARLWQRLGVSDAVTLELNSLGSSEARAAYRAALVDYLQKHQSDLDEDSQRRLTSNPLRILDSKDAATQQILENAPKLLDCLDDDSHRAFETLKKRLDLLGIGYRINPKLVRGLDYYNQTVFEWVTDQLGAQGTVCGGGRYDGLAQLLGGKATPAAGFAMGLERLLLLLETLKVVPPDQLSCPLPLYICPLNEQATQVAFKLSEDLRSALPGLHLQINLSGGNVKNQLKKADKSEAQYALLLGEDELARQVVQCKPLRGQGEQQEVIWRDLAGWVSQRLFKVTSNED
ncbi:histidine--tRNA ligase [Ventosimonas gracilis]|uniref:Histidine--tRNA ligase n=1 Tax=Ventosimonas gracilis TaxID=1680762 RepID=A0A139SY41_9GAMM|nr:histidine--tRNA ligase [Ventosimonas gracilis]KXU39302.1 histidine--tRNA ligase [Ventosimonas gracilis]